MTEVLPTYDFQIQHGLQYPSFTPPPLDGSLALAQIVDWHAERSKDHVYATFATSEGLREVTWGELGAAVHRAARTLLRDVPKPGVIAVLANRDTLTYVTLFLAILRAGGVPCLLSPRNSAAGVVHLLQNTEATHIYGSEGEAEAQLIREVLATPEASSVELLQAPVFEDLYNGIQDEGNTLPDLAASDPEATTIILHSSGSTAFPKPIRFSHIFLLQWVRSPMYGKVDLAGVVAALQAVPPFHASGFYQAIGVSACTGARVSVFPPQNPPVLATPDSIMDSWRQTKATFVITPPANLVTWSQDEDAIRSLIAMKYVRNSGGPLPKAIGDMLARRGVNLYQGWGSTEIGPVTITVQKEPYGLDWDWIELQANTHPILEPQDDEGKVYELIMKGTRTHVLAMLTDKEQNLYHTNDLVEKHPTKPGLIRIVGRKDDQIMLSTGEKTNPGPLESIIRGSPLVKACVYFGRARFQNGILVEPQAGAYVDPANEKELSTFRNKIWPYVEEANAFAPSHSRVFKEMILVTSPSKPMYYTTKGSVARPRTLELYDSEIEKLYDTVQASATNSAPLPKTWQLQDVQPYVLQTVLGVMRPNGGALNDTQDLFLQGCDSLQSTFIRNRLAAGLRQAQFAGVKVPADLVYKAPSIKALSEFLSTAVTLGVAATEDPQVAGKAVEEMVAKYAIAFPAHRGEDGPPRHGSVIITGTTGNLGCYLLHSFASSSEVGRVYALNRAAKIDLQSRQRDALVDRGIDASFLDSEKVELVEADLAQSGMGISQELLSEMGRNVTLIISNAWRLDFNVGLGSFEPNVQSLRNLVDFSLTSRLKTPPRIINISSVSSIGSKPSSGGQPLLEELSETCESSLMGYGRSKHVSERLLAAASSSTGLQTCSVRVGQLSGSRTNGAWNATDWVALLAKSAETLRCLPSSTEQLTWLPIDEAARAIFDFSKSTSLPPVLHLLHPHPVAWNDLLHAMASDLNVSLVGFDDWLSKLGEHPDASANPAIKLQSYFTAKASKATSTAPAIGLSTTVAQKMSPTLRGVKPLGAGDVQLWLQYWHKLGFLKD